MKTIFRYSTFAFVVLALNAIFISAQQPESKTVPVQGNFYETATLKPEVARIKSLKLPSGFSIAKFAEITNPRILAVAPDGTVYVSQRVPGTLSMLKDTNGDGVADVQKVVAEKEKLHGIALHDGKMYIINVRELYVADVKSDGTLGELKMLLDDLPDAGQHPNRTLAVGPDNKLYVSIGSTCNACDESNVENATMLQMDLDGRNRRVFAAGLRNTIGFGWHPQSRRFFGWDQGIDWLGDDIQKEEFNEILDKQKYGWAYVYEDGKVYPHGKPPAPLGLTSEDWAKQSRNPSLMHTAHSAGMQMAFYTGAMFPAEYKNDAFVALRGSWNRNPPSGYELARVRFDRAGNPTRIETFISGFIVRGGAPGGKDGHFARPVGVAQMKDGAMLLTDDTNNIIYRISYNSKTMPPIMTREDVSLNLPETANARGTIQVRSAAFSNMKMIPDQHSAYFADVSPEISWSGVPANAKSLVLMMEDPDANLKPVTHWIAANIAPTVTGLPENVAKTEMSNGVMQGANHTGKIGYYGPMPPPADLPHGYHFQVFALDKMLDLPSGFNRQALLDAMKNHVVAKGEIVGMYQRKPDVREKK